MKFIITTHPTQIDLDRAEKEDKLILCTYKRPDSEVLEDVWKSGFMQGLGITLTDRVLLIGVPDGVDQDASVMALINLLSKKDFRNAEDITKNIGNVLTK